MNPDPNTLWRRLGGSRGGRWVFSLGVALKAPYFLTIRPQVVELEPGRSVVTAKKRWRVHNHIGTFHAIAMCNLAEITMGLVAEATVPRSHRWIPLGIEAEYLLPGKTSLRGEAILDPIPEFGDEKFDVVVPVRITDTDGQLIAQMRIPIRISPRNVTAKF